MIETVGTFDEKDHVGYLYVHGKPGEKIGLTGRSESVPAEVILDLTPDGRLFGIEVILPVERP